MTTAIRSGGSLVVSAMTSLIRIAEPSSTPFIRETTTVSGASSGARVVRLARAVWEGTVRTVKSASAAASAGSVVARTEAGSTAPGR